MSSRRRGQRRQQPLQDPAPAPGAERARVSSLEVSSRMTMVLVVAGLVLLSVYGVYTMVSEERELRDAASREIELLGRSLKVAFENALRDRQPSDVIETVEKLQAIDPAIEVFIYDHTSRPLHAGSSAGLPGPGPRHDPQGPGLLPGHPADEDALEEESLGGLLDGMSGSPAYWVPAGGEPGEHPAAGDERTWSTLSEGDDRLVLTANLREDDGRHLGRLVLVRPMGDIQRDLASTRGGLLWMLALFAVLTTLVGRVAGASYLRRPLRRMLRAIGKVRAGDLSSRLEVSREDEIGLLAREFNAMCADLQAARASLERQEANRSRIERAMQRADKLIAVGQLSAGLAHEIGSPLQVVSGRARALLNGPLDPERTRHHAGIIAAQSERITRIVEQLLHVSRRRKTRMASVDPGRVLAEIVDLLRVESSRKGLSLCLHVTDGMPAVEADPDQLQQVAMNLLTNAIAATRPGGRIEIEIVPDTLRRPGAARPVNAMRLSVSDEGDGIPEEIRGQLFEPFFTTRSAEGGTGLGLTVVAAIVGDHAGDVTFDSSAGHGSRFVVRLPLRQPGTMAREACA